MYLSLIILTILSLSQISLVNSNPGLIGDLLKPLDNLFKPVDNLLRPVDSLLKPASDNNILTNLHNSLEKNKINFLSSLFGNTETDVCGQKASPPKGILGLIGILIKTLTNIVGTVLKGLNQITSYLGVTIDIQTQAFDMFHQQEQTQSETLQNYVNTQFQNIVNSAGQTIDLASYVDAVNSCMKKLVEQAKSSSDNSKLIDCNVPIDALVDKLNESKGQSGTNGLIDNILTILDERRTTIDSILDARDLIDSYTTDSFMDTVHIFVSNVETCMKDKLPEADYKELVNMIDSLENDLNLDGLDLNGRVDVINNLIVTVQTWIDGKVNTLKR